MELTRTEPLVVAVVISRNEEPWIETTLQAALAAVEPFPDSEVVLVDSCSHDRTVARAQQFPVRLVELRPNAPLSPALGRLVGQDLTRSRYVLFVDGDTEIDAAWVATGLDYLERHPSVAAVDGKLPERYYEDGRQVGSSPDVFAAGDAPAEVEGLGGNALYRRSALEGVGSFNPFIVSYEEAELAARLRKSGIGRHPPPDRHGHPSHRRCAAACRSSDVGTGRTSSRDTARCCASRSARARSSRMPQHEALPAVPGRAGVRGARRARQRVTGDLRLVGSRCCSPRSWSSSSCCAAAA